MIKFNNYLSPWQQQADPSEAYVCFCGVCGNRFNKR